MKSGVFYKIALGAFLILAAPVTTVFGSEDFADDFYLKVEELARGPEDSNFKRIKTWIDEEEIELTFLGRSVVKWFGNYKLQIESVTGIDNARLTVELKLFNKVHPMNDPITGLSRNLFRINDPVERQIIFTSLEGPSGTLLNSGSSRSIFDR